MANPGTHRLSTLHGTFVPDDALRIAGRFGIHLGPNHGSWLNMAEPEMGPLRGQCRDSRIPDRQKLCREVAAWQRDRNGSAKPVNRRFPAGDARIRQMSLQPSVQ